MFSLAGIPPLFGFWPKFLVFNAAVAADLVPLAVIGIAASVIGAFYYLKVVKTMYFDDPAEAYGPADSRINMAMVAATALFVSPLGYLAIPLLSAATANAARALFCPGTRAFGPLPSLARPTTGWPTLPADRKRTSQ